MLRLLIRSVFNLLLFVGLAIIIYTIYKLYSFDHSEFISWILTKYGKADKTDLFISDYLPESRYKLIRMISWMALIIYCVIFIRYRKSLFNHLEWVRQIFSSRIIILKNEIAGLPVLEKVLFFVLMGYIILLRFVLLFKLPFQIDEVNSYLFFVDKGFLVTAAYYPAPNNHILYNLVAGVFNLLGFSPELVMKLPAFIISIFLSVVIFAGIKRKVNYEVAFITTAIFSTSLHLMYYSVSGRGYILLVLMVFVLVYQGIKAFSGELIGQNLFLFIMAAVAGFYAIPVFLYPYVSFFTGLILVLLIKKNYTGIKQVILASVVSVIFVLIVYSPVILFNGLSALISNSWVSALSSKEFHLGLSDYIREVPSFLFGFDLASHYAFILVVMAGLTFLWVENKWEAGIIIIAAFLVPFLMLFVQKVLPFVRVWIYLIPVISLLISLWVYYPLESSKYKRTMIPLITALLLSFQFSLLNDSFLSKEDDYYKELDSYFSGINHQNGSSVLITDDAYGIYYRYYVLQNEGNTEILSTMGDSGHTDPKPQIIIIGKQQVFPIGLDSSFYLKSFENQYITEYRKVK
ncbi:MAG: hypothetical protein ACK40G_12645 [Cytophagaceae bacterium]